MIYLASALWPFVLAAFALGLAAGYVLAAPSGEMR